MIPMTTMTTTMTMTTTISTRGRNPTGRTDRAMLFDLRGRGRRRTVQVIYLSLAILMGGGLVLFGIGSSSSGGLFDAINGGGNGGGGTSVDKVAQQRIDTYNKRLQANPSDQASWLGMA